MSMKKIVLLIFFGLLVSSLLMPELGVRSDFRALRQISSTAQEVDEFVEAARKPDYVIKGNDSSLIDEYQVLFKGRSPNVESVYYVWVGKAISYFWLVVEEREGEVVAVWGN